MGAYVAGVPAAIWAGQVSSWRLSYIGVGLLGLVTVAAGTRWMPRLPVHGNPSIARELAALRNGPLWLVFIAGAVGFGGMFAVYSYVSPLLTGTAGFAAGQVPLVLSLFGAGMTLGALVGGLISLASLKSARRTRYGA